MEENKYQVLQFSFHWRERHADGKEIENGTCFDRMLKEEVHEAEFPAAIEEWWKCYLEGYLAKYPDRVILERTKGTVKDLGRFAWCLTWFSHFTYNTWLDDDEILASFENYVREVTRHNEVHGHFDNMMTNKDDRDSYICLMGAEDRFRWKGPCRCEHCQTAGVVRIDH
jgi:hypothetical protein